MILSYVTRTALTLVLAGMAGGGLKAQDTQTKWFVGGALINQLDSAKNITNNSFGFGIQAGADFQFKGYTFRTGFALNALPGSSISGTKYNEDADGAYGTPYAWTNKTSLKNYQVFGDFVFPSGYQKLDLTFGVSLNRWFYDATVTPDADGAYTIVRHTGNDHIPGLKGGIRLGAEYRFNKNLSAELMFQIVELGHAEGGDANGTTDGRATLYHWELDAEVANPMYGKTTHGSNENPSWIQLGVKYHF